MTGQMLERLGYQVAVAYSGEDALRQLGGAHFDVVVSDLGMGTGMNGWELAAEVRRRWPEVRFYLASGWGAAVRAPRRPAPSRLSKEGTARCIAW